MSNEAPQTLTKNGVVKTFTTAERIVAAKFDGWRPVEKEGSASPRPPSPAMLGENRIIRLPAPPTLPRLRH